jgi:hypothetical protein
MKEGSDKSVSAWEKAKILSVIVASVFIPLAVALSGNWYAKSLEKDTQARFELNAVCAPGEQIKLQDSCMDFSVSKTWAKWESEFI